MLSSSRKQIQMIISISGMPGSGKTSLAKFLAKKLKLKLYIVGKMVREIARKRGLSVIELDKAAINDRTIDEEIDKIHSKLKNKDNFVIDSRIAFNFFPKSLKIFLYCKPEIAAKRIFNARRPSEDGRLSLKAVLREIKERDRIDILRYKKYYGVDISNLNNYDLVVDTSDFENSKVGALKMSKFVLDALNKLD